jgi:hypothetical protein
MSPNTANMNWNGGAYGGRRMANEKRKVWHISCHGDNGDCSNDPTPNVTLEGKFYCDKHLNENRNQLKA